MLSEHVQTLLDRKQLRFHGKLVDRSGGVITGRYSSGSVDDALLVIVVIVVVVVVVVVTLSS